MFAHIQTARTEEPPSSRAALLAGKLSQAFLLVLLGGPIAIFAGTLLHRLLG